MNQVVLCGRLTRDPEVRYSSGERPIAITRYTLAVDRRGQRSPGKDSPDADFIPCLAFDRAGEFAEKYFQKGMRVLVSGRIQTGSYTNREGQKVYTTEVIVNSQEFADGRRDDVQTAPNKSTQVAREGRYKQSDFMSIPDSADAEGLPFN